MTGRYSFQKMDLDETVTGRQPGAVGQDGVLANDAVGHRRRHRGLAVKVRTP